MKMKSITKMILVGMMVIGLGSGCASKEVATFKEAMQIAALNGPTGMGMTKLMSEGGSHYEINLYQSADEIVGKVVSGEIDIACVPSNLAAVLYQKTEQNIYLLGTNTLGVLYIMENGDSIHSLEDLKGKKIVASGKGSTPEYVINELLIGSGIHPEKDVEIEYLGTHTDVVTELVAHEGTIALLAQPHVTVAESKSENVRIAVDLNEVWQEQEQTNLPMGVIIGNKAYVDEHEKEVEVFLADYKASVQFVNESSSEAAQLMAEVGILSSADIAMKAIPNCYITYIEASEAKQDLEKFYAILLKVNPQSVGGSLPDEAFYYSK